MHLCHFHSKQQACAHTHCDPSSPPDIFVCLCCCWKQHGNTVWLVWFPHTQTMGANSCQWAWLLILPVRSLQGFCSRGRYTSFTIISACLDMRLPLCGHKPGCLPLNSSVKGLKWITSNPWSFSVAKAKHLKMLNLGLSDCAWIILCKVLQSTRLNACNVVLLKWNTAVMTMWRKVLSIYETDVRLC